MRAFFLELGENFLIAFRAVRTHKLRSLLTTLGIIIGIIAVTAMAMVINGVEENFDQEMANLGTDVLYIQKWPWATGPGFRWWDYINRPEITADLADVIQQRSRYAAAAVPVVSTGRQVRFQGNDISNVSIEASTADFPNVFDVEVALGRFYSPLEDRSARNVCVIGAQVADQLFPVQQPLGKHIRIDGHRFQVIGVMARQGSGAEGPNSDDSEIKIPFGTFKSIFGIRYRSVTVNVRVESAALIEEAEDEITGILRVARRLDAMEENDFEINQQQSLREQLAPIKAAIYGIGIFLTSLSLLVGGIGVMNIMFVSVKERTKEIGLRKAVGARRRTILIQFLIESVFVCMLGGSIGILISLLLTGVVSAFLPASLPVSTVLLAFAICAAIGVMFGLAPAWTAAKAEPIDALRYE